MSINNSSKVENLLEELGIRPTNQDAEFELVDRLCTEFEAIWQPTNLLEDILEFVGKVEKSARARLLLELCLTDQELRWRHWSKMELERLKVGTSLTDFNERVVRPREYSSTLNADGILSELLSNDLKCRCRYGDLPAPTNPAEISSDENLEFSASLSVIHDGCLAMTKPFCGMIHVGRQEALDPPPFSMNGNLKLVVADQNDKTISRKQLSLSFHTKDLAWVHNTSNKRDVAISTINSRIDREILPSGEKKCFRIPATIHLDTIQLIVNRQ